MAPPNKKAKRPTPLETKLENLQWSLRGLRPIWEGFDPGLFMEQMRYTRKQIDALTPNMVGEFIETGECNQLLHGLDAIDHHLLEVTPSMSSRLLEWTQRMRNDMSEYLGCVRESLKGQS